MFDAARLAGSERALSVPSGMVADMLTWILALVSLVLGALGAWLVARSRYAASLASASTERDLLRERVGDLEASLEEDRETAILLAPLRETLFRVERQVGVLERDRSEQFGSIRTMLARVESEAGEVGRATAALAGSLRSANVRGAWGEVQLRRILELSGMLRECDFGEQVSTSTPDGARIRPDVVVKLPGEKVLVIDAKAPMTHFLDAQADGLDDRARSSLLASHAKTLEGHVRALASKEYWSAFSSTPEFVVCFVPSEAMLTAALAEDPGLHERALSRNIILVGPGSLLALLKAVAVAWRSEALSANARELLELGRELHQRLGTLGSHTNKLGRSLQSSIEAYNAFVGTLESRVLVTARRMNDLGVANVELSEQQPISAVPRALTTVELLDAVTADDDRPELLFDPTERGSGRVRRESTAS